MNMASDLREAAQRALEWIENPSDSTSLCVIVDSLRAALAVQPREGVGEPDRNVNCPSWDDAGRALAASFFGHRAPVPPSQGEGMTIGQIEGHSWLPIESAPKDGATIFVYGLPESIETVTYRRAASYTAAWDSLDDAFFLSGGTWVGPFIEPTHWMPLPKPPVED